jgi:hypothetical protein
VADYDYLDEMRVRFANNRLKEFVLSFYSSSVIECELNLDTDKRVGFGNYVFQRSLVVSHKAYFKIESMLKANKISGETFGIHYDTLMLQLMTWIRYSIDSRAVDCTLASGREDYTPDSINGYLGFSSALSQMLMNELMGSGDDSSHFTAVDNIIKNKVDGAFEKNQELLRNASRAGRDTGATIAQIVLLKTIMNSKESLKFAIEKWKLSSAEKKQFTDKLSSSLKEQDDKMIFAILFKAIQSFEPEIDDLYKDIVKLHAQIFKE